MPPTRYMHAHLTDLNHRTYDGIVSRRSMNSRPHFRCLCGRWHPILPTDTVIYNEL